MTATSTHRVKVSLQAILRGLRRPQVWITLVVLSVGVWYAWPRTGLGQRVANETIHFPQSAPSGTSWKIVNAFPHLKFFEPTCVVAAQDGSNRLFILERRGTIQVVQNDPNTREKRLFLDVFDRIAREPYEDDGALGMVLHPEFGQPDSPNRGYFYVFYTANVDGQRYDRLARFTVPDGSDVADPNSRLILIDQLDRDIWHNGGALVFGPDGFLYVGVGDEGGNAPDEFANGQRIDKSLFCGILRIDVDQRGGDISHPIRRQPENGRTAHYYIPSDNPFVGQEDVLEEFWSTGLRNPHRMAFDPVTGKLWVGDVGQQFREEVNIAFAGSNHQWSYREGNLVMDESWLKGQKPANFQGIEAPPLWEYPHMQGNNCVIGGLVYRGSKYPELNGKYIFGDNGSGRVWALTQGDDGQVSIEELVNMPFASKTGLSSFGEDADGELLIVILGDAGRNDGSIYRLEHDPNGRSTALPERLSETGIFSDLSTLTPASGVYPYGVNAPLWSDGAVKQRWIMLPGDGKDPAPRADRIEFHRTGPWNFPPGTVLVKQFDLPVDERNPSDVRRVETRVLVTTHDAIYGFTYKWNEQGTEAFLLDGGEVMPIPVTTADGSQRTQLWQFPSRAECLVCHNKQAGYVLGVNTQQLNGPYHYPNGVVANQLAEWSRAGLFTKPLAAEEIADAPRLFNLHDQSVPLELRVMSYLDANCSACHRPGGVRANFDARFETPLAEKNLILGKLHTDHGQAGAMIVRPQDPSRSVLVQRLLDGNKRMPTLGVMRRDTQAIAAISQWIDSLTIPADLKPVNDPKAQADVAADAAAEAPIEAPPVTHTEPSHAQPLAAQ